MVQVKGNTVEFTFFRPGAKRVHVCGDFNHWRTGELRMARTHEGYWRARIALPPGEFKFRYWADGQWFTDYAAFGVECGPFGLDSIVYVPNQPLRKISASGSAAAIA